MGIKTPENTLDIDIDILPCKHGGVLGLFFLILHLEAFLKDLEHVRNIQVWSLSAQRRSVLPAGTKNLGKRH